MTKGDKLQGAQLNNIERGEQEAYDDPCVENLTETRPLDLGENTLQRCWRVRNSTTAGITTKSTTALSVDPCFSPMNW